MAAVPYYSGYQGQILADKSRRYHRTLQAGKKKLY
jgi:hypothetical protein